MSSPSLFTERKGVPSWGAGNAQAGNSPQGPRPPWTVRTLTAGATAGVRPAAPPRRDGRSDGGTQTLRSTKCH